MVEYRVEPYAANLGGHVEALRATEFSATCGTTGLDSQLDGVSDVALTPRA